MVPHGLCGFSRESPAPIIRIEPISNFNFFCFIDQLMKETAIANQLITLAMNDRKLRWKPIPLPADDFVQKRDGLFSRVNAERKAHEIGVGEERGQRIEIILAEWTQN